jgi:hypothetical protein
MKEAAREKSHFSAKLSQKSRAIKKSHRKSKNQTRIHDFLSEEQINTTTRSPLVNQREKRRTKSKCANKPNSNENGVSQ